MYLYSNLTLFNNIIKRISVVKGLLRDMVINFNTMLIDGLSYLFKKRLLIEVLF